MTPGNVGEFQVPGVLLEHHSIHEKKRRPGSGRQLPNGFGLLQRKVVHAMGFDKPDDRLGLRFVDRSIGNDQMTFGRHLR